jgi:hypothetical protein
MTGPRDLIVVYSLPELMFPTQIQEDYERQMECGEEYLLGGLEIAVRELPKSDEWGTIGFGTWQAKKFRRVYGFRGEWPVVVERAGGLLGGELGLVVRRMMGPGMECLDDALEGMVLNDDG